MKYSLWLCPPATSAAFGALDKLLLHASKRLESERFEPHLTLFSPVIADSDEDAVDQVREFAKVLTPGGINVNIAALETGHKYYQCVVLGVARSKGLLEANSAACQHWNKLDLPPFFPHVSVVYGDFVNQQLDAALSLVDGMLPKDLKDLSFEATEIRVVSTVGPCNQWRTAGVVRIG
ncbi:hypothetical protein EV174_005560 [Coemansia sp. RSA 2320]|nr:hypothetical protein EV174_005560 [Coemansia sp. RSA 2320]